MKTVESRVVTQITNDPANDLMPRFSPDGSRIAFASDRSGNWDIYVMPATGGKPIQVTEVPVKVNVARAPADRLTDAVRPLQSRLRLPCHQLPGCPGAVTPSV